MKACRLQNLVYIPDDYLIAMGCWLSALAGSLVVLLKLRRRWRTWPRAVGAVHALLSCWMLLLCLTAIELYFAVVVDRTDSFNKTNISQRWFKRHVSPQQKALLFSTGEGTLYRDSESFPKTLSDDQRHILFIGDSFTFGHGLVDVEQRFSNRIRTQLRRESGDRLVVSNLADAGRDLHWVEHLLNLVFSDGYRVDSVIYVVCLNDIETFHERHRTFYPELDRNNPTLWIFGRTYFFNFLYFRLRQFTMPEIRGYYSFVQDYYETEPWLRMQAKLTQLRDLCRSHDAELRVVVFPFLHSPEPDYPFQAAHDKFVQWGQAAGVRVLDLEPALAPHRSEGLTVNPFDAHPNSRAHQIAADAIRTRLLDDLSPIDSH